MEPNDNAARVNDLDHRQETLPPESMRWLAYELHDGLLPWLQSAYMLLNEMPLTPESDSRHRTALRLMHHAMDEGRQLMGFLEASGIEVQTSLSTALGAVIDRIQPLVPEKGQTLIVTGSCEGVNFKSLATVWNIVRIVQQALMNAVQHAGPSSIELRIAQAPKEIIIEVLDHGNGFELSQVDMQNHFGVSSMRHRAKSILAGLELTSQLGRGTRVQLRVPLDAARS